MRLRSTWTNIAALRRLYLRGIGLLWAHLVGGALKCCRQVAQVLANDLVARLCSGCGEFLGTLAIDGGAADGDYHAARQT